MPRRLTLDPETKNSDRKFRTTVMTLARTYHRLFTLGRAFGLSLGELIDEAVDRSMEDEPDFRKRLEAARKRKKIASVERRALAKHLMHASSKQLEMVDAILEGKK